MTHWISARLTGAILLSLFACLPLSAGSINGVNNTSVTFQTDGTLTFVGVSPAASSSVGNGSPNVGTGNVGATGNQFSNNTISAETFINNRAALAGQTIDTIFAEAFSQAVRITNNAGFAQNFDLSFFNQFSIQAFGPGSAYIAFQQQLQRFNTGTQQWDPVFSNVADAHEGNSNTGCAAGCAATVTLSVAANSAFDYRVYARLDGSASTPAGAGVPEPSTWMLLSSALGLAALRRRR